MSNQNMKAAIIKHYSEDSNVFRYENVVKPYPGVGELLIKVQANGINHCDIDLRKGLFGVESRMPHVMGVDAVGEVWSRVTGRAPGLARFEDGAPSLGGFMDWQAICTREWTSRKGVERGHVDGERVELGALAVIDAVSRQLPGVLGNEDGPVNESFAGVSLLEYPQYTRPREWRGHTVPEVLLSGNHAEIDRWRHQQRLIRTAAIRPDLFARWCAEHPDEADAARRAIADDT